MVINNNDSTMITELFQGLCFFCQLKNCFTLNKNYPNIKIALYKPFSIKLIFQFTCALCTLNFVERFRNDSMYLVLNFNLLQ